MTLQKFPLLDEILRENKELKSMSGNRGKFPGGRGSQRLESVIQAMNDSAAA
ncbi:MAG: hypothetical protein ACLQFI_17965 [Methylocella sp.]